MHSVPVAIAWESFRRGIWLWVASTLGVICLMSAFFSAFRFQGLTDFDDPGLKRFHLTFALFTIFVFGMVTIVDLESWRRHFLLPLPTSSLVACRMFPGMVLSAIQVVLVITVLNETLNLNWPVWRLALFAAMISASIQAAIWFAEKSALLIPITAVVGGVIGTWFYFGITLFSRLSDDGWRVLTNFDVVGAIAFTIIAFVFGVAGVARNRCGEQLKPFGIEAWLNELFDFDASESRRFRSAIEAQRWFMWKKKGWLLPGIMMTAEIIAITCWLFFSRDPEDLIGGFVAGGAVLSIMGMISGLVCGNPGSTDTNSQIGPFLASRPVTSQEIARTMIRVLANSVLIAWLIWSVSFAIVFVVLHFSGINPSRFLPATIDWWYLPVMLLVCWTIASFFTVISLVGRQQLVAKLLSGLLVFAFISTTVSACTLPRDSQLQLYLGVVATIGIGFVLVSAGILVIAHRRRLIEFTNVLISIGLWIVLTTIVTIEWNRHPHGPVSYYFLAVGIAALSVSPIASAPLALSWNRHR